MNESESMPSYYKRVNFCNCASILTVYFHAFTLITGNTRVPPSGQINLSRVTYTTRHLKYQWKL